MQKLKTEQEKFWVSQFGDEYTQRNQGQKLLSSNIALFSKILSRTRDIDSIIEFGANTGINLLAIKQLINVLEIAGIEINKQAANKLSLIDGVKVYNQSILDFVTEKEYDFVLSKGVLIHLNPEVLPLVYDLIYKSSKKYICIVEYYNPVPVQVSYRDYSDRLFKRDFAGEILDKFKDVILVDYGFAYHRDKYFPQDDVTWFLLEKI